MPLSNLQRSVLQTLASQRDPESYVAGASALNQKMKRYSADIDIFHDREERVSQAAQSDARILIDAGYDVVWLRRSPLIYTATVEDETGSTQLDWVADSDFRFFPTVPDQLFGYLLHPIDLATNKVMAAAGRREVRDLVDLVTVHDAVLPLGALIWAATEKSPGFTPEGLIAEMRRNSNYPVAEWRAIQATEPIDPIATTLRLRNALREAEAFVLRMPTSLAGLLFLENNTVVQPDPDRLGIYETHAGQRRGHWPGSYDIDRAMLSLIDRPIDQHPIN